MKIYIDKDFKAHQSDVGTMRAVEADFFEGKCAEFIEGYRFVPEGETWTREDGQVFCGEMIAPWRDYTQLEQYQAIYERMLAQQLNDMAQLVEEVYQSDLEMMTE